jgi:hypothetical protein
VLLARRAGDVDAREAKEVIVLANLHLHAQMSAPRNQPVTTQATAATESHPGFRVAA